MTDLLTVVIGRIARLFSGVTRAVVIYSIWHAGLLHKLKSYGISGSIFNLISSLHSNRQLPLVLDGKS